MTSPASRPFWSCAREELLLAVRSRLLRDLRGVFGVLALLVASSGYVLTGGTGLQDFSRTAASLVELVLLVVPLASLVIGVTALTPESGAAELLYSQPVARHTILLGKLAGLLLALACGRSDRLWRQRSRAVLADRSGRRRQLPWRGVRGGRADGGVSVYRRRDYRRRDEPAPRARPRDRARRLVRRRRAVRRRGSRPRVLAPVRPGVSRADRLESWSIPWTQSGPPR